MDPLVSIVTPCYNAGECIAQTIDSVLSQSIDNWEMLIVDDCSSDNSADIVKTYVKKDPRIKYYKTSSPSGSPALPRNMGIEAAEGKYVAFLDADDIWLPNKLHLEVEWMRKNAYDIVYSYYEKMNWYGVRNNRIVKTRTESNFQSLLKSNSIPCLTSIVSRKAIGYTRFKQIPQEDFCFWLDILKKGYTAYNICEVTALYRESQNSRSANKFDMFKGYWNVIRNHQKINFMESCFYMLTYSIQGLVKYLK